MVSMKTAEQFLKSLDERSGTLWTESDKDICEAFVEFAKMHVEKAKKEYERIILQEGLVTEAGVAYLDNAYPLDLIK